MTTTIGSATKTATGKVAKLYVTLGMTEYFIAAGKNWTMDMGYQEILDYVNGSQVPWVLTGGLDGRFEFEWLFTTDALLALISPDNTTYELPEVTIKADDVDTQASPVIKRVTVTAKIFRLRRVGESGGDGSVKLTGSGRLTSKPQFGP
jgi:hypothetical protein